MCHLMLVNSKVHILSGLLLFLNNGEGEGEGEKDRERRGREGGRKNVFLLCNVEVMHHFI